MRHKERQRVSCKELSDQIQGCPELKSIFGNKMSKTFCTWIAPKCIPKDKK